MKYEGQTSIRDALSQKFPEATIRALEIYGDTTLEDLYEHIAYQKSAWFYSIHGLTESEATRILNWLKENAPDVGEILPSFYPEKTQLPATLPAAENDTFSPTLLALPETLSGAFGTNRSEGTSSIEAQNDLEAIGSWLKARAANPNTRSQYKKEAERFLLWITMERNKALSSALAEDASAYYRWLEELGRTDEATWKEHWNLPQSTWIGPKNAPRLSKDWKPFNGPLSPASRKAATTAVRLLFGFLTKTNYLRSNPFDQVSSKIRLLAGEGAPKAFADRSLSSRQWDEILEHLEAMPESIAKSRMRVILHLGKGLGMRASEMINATTGWIVERRVGDEEITVIEIVGKGDKVRRLPLSKEALAAINRYLARRGHQSVFQCVSNTPLLVSLGGNKKTASGKLSRSGLYKALIAFFSEVAACVDKKSPADAEKLRAGSTHWLRHTFAMSALKSMDINIVQTAMGHASIGTTSRYLAPEEAELARAMKKMKPL